MERKTYKNVIENKKYVTFALAEIMAAKPFHEISVTEVCKKAGVSKNTFYRHFETLSDVIYQALEEISEKTLSELSASENKGFETMTEIVCRKWYENRKIFKGFTQEEVIYIIRSFMIKSSKVVFNDLKSEDHEIFLEFNTTVLCMFLRWWSERDFLDSPEKVKNLIMDCICGNVYEKMSKTRN